MFDDARARYRALRARFDRLPPIACQFVAYGTIGTFTTLFDAGLFALIVSMPGWREGVLATIASTGSYMTAALIAYVLNSRIAFSAHHRGDSVRTIARFATTFASSALLAAAVFAAAHALLGSSTAGLMGAKGAAIVTVIAWNFTFLRLWVFPAPPAPAPPGSKGVDAH